MTHKEDMTKLMTKKLITYYNKNFKGKLLGYALYDALRQETIEFTKVYTSFTLIRDSLVMIEKEQFKNMSQSEQELLNASINDISKLCDDIWALLFPVSDLVKQVSKCR